MLAGSRIVTIWDMGKRLADMRERLGKTQADLGADVDFSPGYISKIERGEVDGLPVGKLLAIAAALDAHVMIVCNAEDDDVREQDSKLILPIRRRLLLPVTGSASVSVSEAELTFEKLRQRVINSTADFNKARYVKLADDLPALTMSIEAAVGIHEDEVKIKLNRLLAHAYIMTAQIVITLRDESLAHVAIERAMEAAENAGDPVLRALAGKNYTWAFTRQGMLGDAEEIAVKLADEIGEPSIKKATPRHLAVWGELHRLASKAAAYNSRPDVARELLSAAHSAAVRLDDGRMDYETYWGVLNPALVGIVKAENAFVQGDAVLALRIGEGIRRTANLHLDWWTSHLRVKADAQTSTRDTVGAIETMKDIRRLAPEWIRNDRQSHDVVITLLRKVSSRRAKNSGLAELAQFMGVQI